MAKYCTRCGKPLEECTCNRTSTNTNATDLLQANMSGLAKLKTRMGIGEPETNAVPNYERGMKIIPDCVKPSEGEIPVKQYTVAELRNRLLGITIGKAEGRIEVTNKRVIFRALGKCISGRMTLQEEFAIDEIAGIEVRREFTTTVIDFLIGLIISTIGTAVGLAITSYISSTAPRVIVALLFGIAALVPFFLLYRKWGLKLLLSGLSFGLLAGGTGAFGRYGMASLLNGMFGGSRSEMIVPILVCIIPAIVALGVLIANLFLYAIRPNLVLVIKTKSSSEAIDIQRKKTGLLGFLFNNDTKEHTGYTEVLPMRNVEFSIRELGAIISDIQKFGDFGIEKWQENCFKEKESKNVL